LDDSVGGSTTHEIMIESELDYYELIVAKEPVNVILDPNDSILMKASYETSLPATRCQINMPTDTMTAGDICWCRVNVDCFETAPLEGYTLFVILDVYGDLFFAPTFTDYDSYADQYPFFNPGRTIVEVLPEFIWPEGTGSAHGLNWYAALVTPDMTSLYGAMDIFTFGWN
ncbi:hypothetical protein K8T06_15545, partial [bacterium]|nr:hypothetical protein [bacterium]